MAAPPPRCQGGLRGAGPPPKASFMSKDKEREQRLAEALRANLRRRKAQQRGVSGREQAPDAEGEGPRGESA